MGWFSSKKKHYVDTNVVRIVEDALVPSTLTNALIDVIVKDTEIVDTVKDKIASSRSFNRMYRYAESGAYYYGLPDAIVLSSDDGIATAVAALESEVGGAVTLDYMYFRPLNNTHAAWKLIYEAGDYDPDTNTLPPLTTEKGFTVYLEKIVAVHGYEAGREPERSAIGTWGGSSDIGITPETPEWVDPSVLANLVINQEDRFVLGGSEAAEIHYIWIDGDGVTQRDLYTLDLSSYDTDQEYYQARYTYAGQRGYWIYDPLTGAHTDLNNIFSAANFTSPGSYFPFAVFRSEGVNRATAAQEGSDEYETTVKLLDYIGLDYRAMADAMHEDPDIGQVDQAVLMMAVPIDSTNEIEIDYLFRYFDDLYDRVPTNARKRVKYAQTPDLQSQFGTYEGSETSYAMDISDADFRMTFSFDAIEKRLKAGSIGAIGTVTNGVAAITSLSTRFAGEEPVEVSGLNARVFRKQVSSHVYEEIKVINPNLRYHIYGDLGAEGSAVEGGFLIPLDYNVCKDMPALHVQELYYRSLHLVFNSHVVQTIKWYQRGAFAVLLTIVAIVVTIATNGATWEAITAAIATGSATAVAIAVFNAVVAVLIEPMIYGYVATQVAEAIGPEAAAWLAVAAAAVAGYKGLKAGGFSKSATAQNLLKASTGLQTGSQSAIGTMMEELMADQEEFLLMANEMQTELDKANALLDSKLNIDPFAFAGARPLVLWGEPTEHYYGRTVHAGNPGAESLNLIQNFVKNSLTLPVIEETLGEFKQ